MLRKSKYWTVSSIKSSKNPKSCRTQHDVPVRKNFSKNCHCECHGLVYSIQLLKKEKIISWKVNPGFDIGNIIDLTPSSRIKLQPVWN